MGNPQFPDDWRERWFANLERDLRKELNEDIETLRKRMDDRVDAVDAVMRQHVERSGHSGEPDSLRRISRLEAWAIGMLTGLLTTAATVLVDLLGRVVGKQP